MILVGRVQQLAYIVYACMPNFTGGARMILDTYVHFFPYDFLSFQHFSGADNFIFFKNLMLYVCPLFVLGRDRLFAFYIFLKKTYLSISKYSLFLLENYEKAVNAHNYRFFWKGLCFNYLISTLWLGFNAGFFESNLFWVCQYAGLEIISSCWRKPVETPNHRLYLEPNHSQLLFQDWKNKLRKSSLHKKTVLYFVIFLLFSLRY